VPDLLLHGGVAMLRTDAVMRHPRRRWLFAPSQVNETAISGDRAAGAPAVLRPGPGVTIRRPGGLRRLECRSVRRARSALLTRFRQAPARPTQGRGDSADTSRIITPVGGRI